MIPILTFTILQSKAALENEMGEMLLTKISAAKPEEFMNHFNKDMILVLLQTQVMMMTDSMMTIM